MEQEANLAPSAEHEVAWHNIHPMLREVVIASLMETRARLHATSVLHDTQSRAMIGGFQTVLAGETGAAAASAQASAELTAQGLLDGQILARKLIDQAFAVAIASLRYGMPRNDG